MRERRATDYDGVKKRQTVWLLENRERVRRVTKERNRRIGIPALGEPMACRECGNQTERLAAGHRYCQACGPAKKLIENRARVGAWAKKNRVRRNAYMRGRFAQNPKVRLNSRMSNAIADSLRTGKGTKSWTALVPYTLQQLQAHLERQFLLGMSWDNMRDWHVDHIVPLASFAFENASDSDFKAAWAMTNLRPLWGVDNIRKNAKRLYLL